MNYILRHNDPKLGDVSMDLRKGKFSGLTLDLSLARFADSFYLVRWRCLIDLALQAGIHCSVVPPRNQNVKDYLGRMDLFRGTDYKYPHQKRSPGTFFPLRKIENDRNDWIHSDAHRVLSHSNVSPNYITMLCEVFSELADNIYFHSGEALNTGWGYAHAQAYKEKIIIALSDVGIGFYRSYKRSEQIRNRSEKQILMDSFEELESSLNPVPRQGYRGIGLSAARDFVLDVGGKIELYSGKSAVCVRKRGGVQVIKSVYNRVEGAWIKMVVPVR